MAKHFLLQLLGVDTYLWFFEFYLLKYLYYYQCICVPRVIFNFWIIKIPIMYVLTYNDIKLQC